jgi:hypothetical protein
MSSLNSTNDAPPPSRSSFWSRLLKWPIKVLVFCFVCWHLFALVVRNPLDLWSDEIQTWAKEDERWEQWKPTYTGFDKWTKAYNKFTGCEQGWSMFTPQLARTAPFLTVRIEFSDGTNEVIPSLNAVDPQSFFRFGGARLRKLETSLYRRTPEKVANSDERPVYAAYVRWAVRRWQQQSPGDKRQPIRVHLYKIRYLFPQPDEDPHHITEGETDPVGTFDPQGKLLP